MESSHSILSFLKKVSQRNCYEIAVLVSGELRNWVFVLYKQNEIKKLDSQSLDQ